MFDFDAPIDRRDTHALKWDMMQKLYGVSPDDGIAMWVADMDFRSPPSVDAALAAAAEDVHGYFGDDRAYKAAITGWMARRHDWHVDPETIATTHGIVAGFALCLRAFTAPGDAVILFTPVYHAFHRILNANGRGILQSPLVDRDGRYEMDLDGLAAALTGREKMVVLCSPHNPGGRVWTEAELRALADFCGAHDLLLVSDEIHHDLLLPGSRHMPMTKAAPEIADRLIMLTATTKAFNIAGALTGNVIIADPGLRARFAAEHLAAGTGANRFGVLMATAAYEGGEAWLEDLRRYLAENARIFDDGVHAIPGLRSMRLEATYLAWVDFSATGMPPEEFTARVEREARIAASHGATFGAGGEAFLRFNIGTQRARIEEAVARLHDAFADLQ